MKYMCNEVVTSVVSTWGATAQAPALRFRGDSPSHHSSTKLFCSTNAGWDSSREIKPLSRTVGQDSTLASSGGRQGRSTQK